LYKSEDQIKRDIGVFIRHYGGSYNLWYVGISEEPKIRLFEGHNVDKNNPWIFRSAFSSEIARRIEKYFLALGADGGDGGGDADAIYIYAYKKDSQTIQ